VQGISKFKFLNTLLIAEN
jgi:hypothetical protein